MSIQTPTVTEDGLAWIRRAGRLWATYETAAAYLGVSPKSMPSLVWRKGLRTLQHGRNKIICKDDLDRDAESDAA